MKEQLLIFANPIAGRGTGRTAAARLEQQLRAANFDVQTLFQPPTEIDPKSINPSAIAALSIGGDGTLREVANLLLAASPTPPPLLPLPLGTANLMARHLGGIISLRDIDGVLATLNQRKIVQLDAARVNNELMLLVAGVGIDGQVVHLLDQMRTGPINIASYVMPAVLTLRDYQFPSITVVVDGAVVTRNRPAIAFIGNVREYGTGFPILIDAKSDDGLLDICVLPCRNYGDLAKMLIMVAVGAHRGREDVVYLRGKSVHVDSPKKVPIQIDGEAAGFTPMQVDVLPAAVPFLVPSW